MPDSADTERLQRATEDIRAEYGHRRERRQKPSPGLAMFLARLDHYEDGFRAAGVLPFGERRILDVGCCNGKWLWICCQRWGAQPQNVVGADLRSDGFEAWRRANPEAPIELVCRPAHQLDFPDASFDVVHHSMMFSSVPDAVLRQTIAQNLWRMLKPGGHLVSYDFWINPVNRKTVGIRRNTLEGLFPDAEWRFQRTITLAPPLSRALKFSPSLAVMLERLRILNTHVLAVLRKPAQAGSDYPVRGG